MVLSFCSAASAQKLHMGLKAGANFQNVSNISSFYEGSNVGFHVGGFAEVGLGKLALQPEVYFSSVDVEPENNSFNLQDINLKYLNIPILLNYPLIPTLSIQAGPQFGIMLDKDQSFTQNGANAFKSGDVGLAAGLQLNLTKFKAYARYVAGLSDISSNDADLKNNQVHIGLGLRLF